MNEARIVNSNIILIGGFGIFIFNILCQIGDYYEKGTLAEHFNLIVWLDYLPEQILFLSTCIILSVCFPHSVEKVKQRDERHQIRMDKMKEKIEQQRTSSMRRKILGEDFKK